MLYNRKIDNNYIGFFQARKLKITDKMASARESFTFENLLKNRKLLTTCRKIWKYLGF